MSWLLNSVCKSASSSDMLLSGQDQGSRTLLGAVRPVAFAGSAWRHLSRGSWRILSPPCPRQSVSLPGTLRRVVHRLTRVSVQGAPTAARGHTWQSWALSATGPTATSSGSAGAPTRPASQRSSRTASRSRCSTPPLPCTAYAPAVHAQRPPSLLHDSQRVRWVWSVPAAQSCTPSPVRLVWTFLAASRTECSRIRSRRGHRCCLETGRIAKCLTCLPSCMCRT